MKKLYNRVVHLCRTKATAKVLCATATSLCVAGLVGAGTLISRGVFTNRTSLVLHGLAVGALGFVMLVAAVAFANR